MLLAADLVPDPDLAATREKLELAGARDVPFEVVFPALVKRHRQARGALDQAAASAGMQSQSPTTSKAETSPSRSARAT